LITGLLAPLVFETSGESKNATIRLRIEDLLVHQASIVEGLRPIERQTWQGFMLATHVGFETSILNTIKFMDGVRGQGLDGATIDYFWETQGRSSFQYKHYSPTDVPDLIRHLVAYSEKRIQSAKDSSAAVEKLKKIWETFREDAVYEEAIRLANASEDKTVQEAFAAIAKHWSGQRK
jgi:hypothetical protein